MKLHTSLLLILFGLTASITNPLAADQQQQKREADKSSAGDIRKELSDAAEAIKNYSIEKRDEAARKAKVALEALDSRINTLENDVNKNWDKMDKAAREKSRQTLKALHEQRVIVAEWYGGLKNSSAAAWEDMKKGFSEAYKALQHAWQEAEHEYENEERRSR